MVKRLAEGLILALMLCGGGFLILSSLISSVEGRDENVITLHEDDTVTLNLPVMDDTVRIVQEQLLDKSDKLGANKPLYLVLNSPGGSIQAGLKLINTAQGLPQRVDTISEFSASMSFIISQELGNRYVMQDSTMMSHHATISGVGGEIPGTLLARTNYLLDLINNISKRIATRAGMSIDNYNHLIQNELWMTADEAVMYKFADKIVKVRCGKDLRGPADPVTVHLGFGDAAVTFHKCPLISEPLSITGSEQAVRELEGYLGFTHQEGKY